MNRELLVSAIGNVSDRFIEEYSSFVGAARRNLSFKKILLTAACFCVALSVVIASFLLHNTKTPEAQWCSLADIEGVVYENVSISRFGHFDMVTPDCWERPISEREVRKLLGEEDTEIFTDEIISTEHTVLRRGDGSIHTIDLCWYFGDGSIHVIIDPSNYSFFQHDDAVVTVNGHELVVMRTMSETDVIVKKGQSGIWIVGNKEEEQRIEKILNFLLNNELDFDAL